MTIPQTSPRLAYLAQKNEIDAAVMRVLASDRYVLGSEVAAFEREFADFVGTRHAVGVANGTDALHLALRAAGVGAGDTVITVANTAVATAAAIEMAGARVAFVDVDDATLTMDPSSLDRMLKRSGQKFRAVIPVHLFGRVANIEEIAGVAGKHSLVLIEDCAQAHGAARNGRIAGTTGAIAAFSFYPTKNLGAIGDGGAVLTNDGDTAERLQLLRQYGWRERDRSLIAGVNSRLDEIQAAILRVKLERLRADNARRRAIAEQYDTTLPKSVRTPPPDPGHVYHQYVVRSRHRDALQGRLRAAGITTLVHYPIPIHLQPAYQGRVLLPEDGLPVTERAAGEILSLPMFPQLTDDEVRQICGAVAG